MKFTLIASLVAAALSVAPTSLAFPAFADMSLRRIEELTQMAREFKSPELEKRAKSTVGKVTYGRKKIPDEGEYRVS